MLDLLEEARQACADAELVWIDEEPEDEIDDRAGRLRRIRGYTCRSWFLNDHILYRTRGGTVLPVEAVSDGEDEQEDES